MEESEFKQTAFRLSNKALRILDQLKKEEDLNNRTMALEFFLMSTLEVNRQKGRV
mgnify:CR=1 FL=1